MAALFAAPEIVGACVVACALGVLIAELALVDVASVDVEVTELHAVRVTHIAPSSETVTHAVGVFVLLVTCGVFRGAITCLFSSLFRLP